MIFNAMWDNETERIGLDKCSKVASNLRGFADIFSLLAVAWLIASFFGVVNGWWALCIWFFGRLLFCFSYQILQKHEFDYNYETICATWKDKSGNICQYTHQDYMNEMKKNR